MLALKRAESKKIGKKLVDIEAEPLVDTELDKQA